MKVWGSEMTSHHFQYHCVLTIAPDQMGSQVNISPQKGIWCNELWFYSSQQYFSYGETSLRVREKKMV